MPSSDRSPEDLGQPVADKQLSENEKSNDQILMEYDIGKLWCTVIYQIAMIEKNYWYSGEYKSKKDVRRYALTMIGIVSHHIRETLKLMADRSESKETRIEFRNLLNDYIPPSPLFLLHNELAELCNNRPSKLLSTSEETAAAGAYNLQRRFIKANAIAATQTLMEIGYREGQAAKLVADTLNAYGFARPGHGAYKAATIKDWRKRKHQQKGDFDAHLGPAHLYFRGMVGRAEKLGKSTEQLTSEILRRLGTAVEMIAYR